jgi:hypothetical protein
VSTLGQSRISSESAAKYLLKVETFRLLAAAIGVQRVGALFEEAFVNPSARTLHLARKSCVGDWALLHLQQINSGRSRIGCNGSSGATPHDSQEIRTK